MALNTIISDSQEEQLNGMCPAANIAILGTKIQDLSSTAANKGASYIGIEDSGGYFTGTSVEDALAELAGPGGTQVDLIFKAATELTIATGAVAATQGAHTIDTEADAASDDLDSIAGGTAEEVIFLRANNAARTVVLKHAIGANLIACPGARDISLAEATDFAILYHNGTQWIVVGYNTLALGGGGLGSALASVANALGASLVGIEDVGANLTAANAEAAFAEILNAGYAWRDKIFKAATELTIATGAVVATQGAHTIDTEADAASDDLNSITGGTAEELLFVRPANAARTVVLKHAIGANLIACPGARDISLAEATDFAILYFDGTQWIVVGWNTLALGGGGLGSALASVANALGASLIGIEDAAGVITAVNVETALAEIGTKVKTAAATVLSALSHIRIVTAGGATADTDTVLPTGTWEFVDAFVVNRAAGTAGDTVQIKKDATAITDAMDINDADNVISRPATIDDAQISLIGGTNVLRVSEVDGGGNDSPAVHVHVTLRRIA